MQCHGESTLLRQGRLGLDFCAVAVHSHETGALLRVASASLLALFYCIVVEYADDHFFPFFLLSSFVSFAKPPNTRASRDA